MQHKVKRMGSIKYPKGETVWVGYHDVSGKLRFIITSKDSNRDFYFLYELIDSQFNKLGKSRSPKDLEEKFNIDAKLREVSE